MKCFCRRFSYTHALVQSTHVKVICALYLFDYLENCRIGYLEVCGEHLRYVNSKAVNYPRLRYFVLAVGAHGRHWAKWYSRSGFCGVAETYGPML